MKELFEELDKIERYIRSNPQFEVSLLSVKEQLELFYEGVKIPILVKPARIGDGIVQIHRQSHDELLELHKDAALNGKLLKFVPASGAATRMFHCLIYALKTSPNFTLNELNLTASDKPEINCLNTFLTNLRNFAFYEDLKATLKLDNRGIESLVKNNPSQILKSLLFEPGLGYESKPKGALKFHNYKSGSRTAFEEQIYESLDYLADKNNKLKIHFTISEEHRDLFLEIINNIELNTDAEYYPDVTYSYQKKSTNTIAVDENNRILFDENGIPVTRPGGHGSLIQNLQEINSDFVIIKNIDNITTENLSSETIFYKKLLTGYLSKVQSQVFDFLNMLEKKDFTKIKFGSIVDFAQEKLFIKTPVGFNEWDIKRKYDYIFNKLNRPIRVCGMVKDEGEPGGGPFWIKDEDDVISLQIIEQVQIVPEDKTQAAIFKQSTHFNPVDIVCALKDYKGKKFDLIRYVDHKSCIISKKSRDGSNLKALELPGLWNGGMYDWITIFIEVPISTFNPVKEINDLLRKEHQNY